MAFVATGIKEGMLMFGVIWLVATLSRNVTKRFKIQYLPRMAILMWLVSLGVLAVLLGATIAKLQLFVLIRKSYECIHAKDQL